MNLTKTFERVPYQVDQETNERVKTIFHEGTAENTRKAYQKDLKYFFEWASLTTGENIPSLPVDQNLIIKFITDHTTKLAPEVDAKLVELGIKSNLGPHKVTTISRRISAISMFHKLQELTPNPCEATRVKELLSKAKKRAVNHGHKPAKKSAMTLDKLMMVLDTSGSDLAGLRTRALLLFAFSSGGRRASEISNAIVENLTDVDSSYTYLISKSKTDQAGHGHVVPITGLAADALRNWLKVSKIDEGPIFRGVTKHGKLTKSLTPTSVSRIIKKHVKLAGLNPRDYSAHSMRSGFITECGKQKCNLGETMALSGHKTIQVAMNYFQAGAVLENPAGKLCI
jgi:integrase